LYNPASRNANIISPRDARQDDGTSLEGVTTYPRIPLIWSIDRLRFCVGGIMLKIPGAFQNATLTSPSQVVLVDPAPECFTGSKSTTGVSEFVQK
jgi:hypothetical protein